MPGEQIGLGPDPLNPEEGAGPRPDYPGQRSDLDGLIFGGDAPSGHRLEQLRAARTEIAAREGHDVGRDDGALLTQIDEEIARLEASLSR